ncbi:pentatricopeptide repeat-containing protein At3g12770 isoform X1 [Amborella trichopoda]|uniref:Pentacotripeptide-repeat region of PRORP domain-containing protein n=1 Tax=Amborella trichopoda TaxID=13333 RepID=W1P9G9_AMBTC|nr:pentatricopeptide repeat-containing protein At3g12770 isoform X1 [Amborella trichopoda]XP_020521758.1 pentatricopeptide repeat-containing protein At3g12770 isoform X1 [Amborella trichopoda]XP_020521759.1 pentatricopeptide repeat-containing protein At3g12770 isoform X1 [Amborella trichopoda]XP_020521760.1 pentatricopeptide repeat-containing protein At3g12770 isoform X1 [Amborella trichopoda]ERN04324.1 hypothetical protein AMTR_s00077p00192220 [Amborella trichopoda]|eukprot:XP_020521757.1 pentatricopeptide repeat-containing protein At3g12770 isoform X1 [Amborella trichopoda]
MHQQRIGFSSSTSGWWNRLLQYHSAIGSHQQVLQLYAEMMRSRTSPSLAPNASTFPSIFRACAYLPSSSLPLRLQLGRAIHAHVFRFTAQSDMYVGSSLIHFYASCCKMKGAHRVFDTMPHRNIVLWTALIQGHAQSGEGRRSNNNAIDMFNRMMRSEDGIRPNTVSMLSVLPTCGRLMECESLHAFAIRSGLDSDSMVGASLTNTYLKYSSIVQALRFFHSLPDKNQASWLVMICGLAQCGLLSDAFSLVTTMLGSTNWDLDSTAIVTLLSASKDKGALEHGRWVHKYVIKAGFAQDVFVGTSLVDMYAKFGFLGFARHVFDHIREKSLVLWNAILYSYAREGLTYEVLKLFKDMRFREGLAPDSITVRSLLLGSSCRRGAAIWLGESIHGFIFKGGFHSEVATVNCLLDFYAKAERLRAMEALFAAMDERERDAVSWNCVIHGYAQSGRGEKVLKLFSTMCSTAIDPDHFTLSSVLHACAAMGDLLHGQCVHTHMIARGYIYNAITRTSLLNMYAKCGAISSAYQLFYEMHVRDTISLNAIISGFYQNGFATEALSLFHNHLTNSSLIVDAMPDYVTLALAISACAQLGSLRVGMCLHSYILRNGFEGNITLGNAIISMYAKCGAIEHAERVFKRSMATFERDLTSWTAMIAGYGMHGRVQEALSLFREMQAEVRPNAVTYLELICACSHGGLVDEGLACFRSMRREHGLLPGAEHYACLVDMLGRAGRMWEAYELIRDDLSSSSSRGKVDGAVWGALMGACRIYGEVALGEAAAAEAMRLEPGNGGYGVLLSNIYSGVGRWEEAAEIRGRVGFMERRPGWSCIQG